MDKKKFYPKSKISGSNYEYKKSLKKVFSHLMDVRLDLSEP